MLMLFLKIIKLILLFNCIFVRKQERKRPLDTHKRMIERRESEGERVKGIYREKVKGRGIERESERKKIERKRRFLLQFLVKYTERRSGKQG